MCFKKKDKKSNFYYDDRKLLKLLSQSIDIYEVLDESKKYSIKLKDIKEQLTYISPRSSNEVFNIDKKIQAALGDLKIILYKKDEDHDMDINRLLLDIEVLIKERESKEMK